MINPNLRAGKFTSSSIGKLMKEGRSAGSFGAVALTYIKEKKYERLIGRSLESDSFSRATSWGRLLEIYFYGENTLPLSVEVLNEVRFEHKEYNWSGSPDCLDGNIVMDLKCPYTLKSFCELSECTTAEDLQEVNDLYFWQLVSNAILIEQVRGTKIDKGRLIVFMPMVDELSDIQHLATTTERMPARELFWIANADHEELPYLTTESKLPNLHYIDFEITEEMKDQLTQRVQKAEELINQ